MARSSSLNRPSSGGLAGRPTTFMGGVRRQDESPEAFRGRMDDGYAGNVGGTDQSGITMPGNSRRDNIVAARANGTFDAKRAAYNQQGAKTGHSMDEAGNIINPSAPPATAGGQLVPGSSPGSAIWKPNAPAAGPAGAPPATAGGQLVPGSSPGSSIGRPNAPAPGPAAGPPSGGTHTLSAPATAPAARPGALMRPVGKINGMPAPLAIEQAKQPPPAPPPTLDRSSPAANKLAAFNAKHPGVQTGAAGLAQTNALAAQRRQQIAVASAKSPLPPSKLGAPPTGGPINAGTGLPGATPIPSLTPIVAAKPTAPRTMGAPRPTPFNRPIPPQSPNTVASKVDKNKIPKIGKNKPPEADKNKFPKIALGK